jgi:RNA polymerase sigma-70 factor (ECF subfamily)
LNPSPINIDSALVNLLRQGDANAFEKLFFNFADRIYYFALRYMRNQHDAEEIVQEVFVKLWENRENLNLELSFSGYLFTIARNTIFNQNRKKVNEQAYHDYVRNYLETYSCKTEDDLIYADIKSLIDKVVEELPPQRKLIYKLSRESGLSYREIAQQLNLSERTVEAHIRLALKTLTEVIDNNFVLPLLIIGLASKAI